MADKEYIERNHLAKELTHMAKYQSGERQQGIFGVVGTIKNWQTADVVEVVRCKDCVHSTLTFGSYICDNIETPWFNDEFAIDMMSDDFCSYGERKE